VPGTPRDSLFILDTLEAATLARLDVIRVASLARGRCGSRRWRRSGQGGGSLAAPVAGFAEHLDGQPE
jgi:hypothetical protein